jgi:hypothetical protein
LHESPLFKKIKYYPEKFGEFPGLGPWNLEKIPEGKSKIAAC